MKKLYFFRVDDYEKIKRITFAHDDAREAEEHRSEVVSRFSQLNLEVIGSADNFPDCVKDLRNNSRIGYFPRGSNAGYDCNLFPIDAGPENAPATVVFLGSSTKEKARQMFDRIASWIGPYLVKRLIIWYRKNDGNIDREHIDRKPRVEDVYMPGNSINKEG